MLSNDFWPTWFWYVNYQLEDRYGRKEVCGYYGSAEAALKAVMNNLQENAIELGIQKQWFDSQDSPLLFWRKKK